jgi:hypothetical protein
MGVEIATNLHDFVAEGCCFVWERSPAVVDSFFAYRKWLRFYRIKFLVKNRAKPTTSPLAIPLLRNNSTLKIR